MHEQSFLDTEGQNTLLNNILDHSPSGIAVVKLIRFTGKVTDGLIIVANNAATKITGIPQQLILNKISKLDSKIVTSILFQEALSGIEKGRPFSTQYFVKGSQKWLELGISKIDDNHLVVVFTDITSSKNAQPEVERPAAQLLSFINTTQSAMSYLMPVKNSNGEVVDFRFNITNAVFTSYVKQSPEAVKGELISKYYPVYKENGFFERYKQTYNTGETVRFESAYKGDGVDGWFDIMCAKIEDGVWVTITDLTKLKTLQTELEVLVQELKKSNENLQEFAYVASHDLQEPLRKIQVFAERLKKDADNELSRDNQKVFDRMIAATERMSQLIKDLLSYSQLSTKTAVFEIIDLKVLVQQVLADLEATIIDKNATVLFTELPAVKGDQMQLRQMFQNLLSNSLKYSNTEIDPVINISSGVVTREIKGLSAAFYLIEIRDNGIGFEQQYAERIFKLFQRLHGRSEYPGTGIGLAIVYKVAENHNGFITAESEPGQGAVFKVYFPV